MSINQIVQLNITRETKVPSRQGFGVALILGVNLDVGERIKYYSTDALSDLATDLTNGIEDPEYKMATIIAMQRPRAPIIAVGRQTGEETVAQALDEIYSTDSSGWYCIISTLKVTADQKLIADWVEAKRGKFFIAASSDGNIIGEDLSTDVTSGAAMSIAAYVKDKNFDKTGVIYHEEASTDHPDAALTGILLPRDPGSYTAMFKDLKGISASELDQTEVQNALEKSCNIYQDVIGIREGTVGSGEYIDVIVFEHWLEAEIIHNVFSMLKRLPKVPFDDSGISAIESEIDKALQTGRNRGGISENQRSEDGDLIAGYEISVPSVFDVPTTDVGNRTLPDVTFDAFLSGAIHHVQIQGRLLI